MFDIRSDQQVANYAPQNPNSGFTSCGTYYCNFLKSLIDWTNFTAYIALSLSGRYLFCGADDNSVYAWDTLKTTPAGKYWITHVQFYWFVKSFNWLIVCLEHYLASDQSICIFIGSLNGHENRVTSITIAPSGFALVSCSWDQYVRVWGWMYSTLAAVSIIFTRFDQHFSTLSITLKIFLKKHFICTIIILNKKKPQCLYPLKLKLNKIKIHQNHLFSSISSVSSIWNMFSIWIV